MTKIVQGIQAYFSAVKLLNTLKLWKYFAIPILISFGVGIIILSSSYYFSDALGDFIAQIWGFEFGKETVTTISHVIGGLAIFAFGLVIYKHLIMALSAPFMSPVSEKIERHLLGSIPHQDKSIKGQTSALARGLRLNLRNLVMEILIIIPLFILGLIPVLGLFFQLLIFLVQAYYAGFGNMDYTLERHYNYKDSIAFVKQRKGVAIGNGIVFMLLLLIPIVGIIIVLPLSVVAATQQTVKELHPEHF